MQPFYMQKNYIGKENETNFIIYLESEENIEWWYKNGNSGSENFAIKYFNDNNQREELFFPDWVVKLKNGNILFLDTKKDSTAKELETKNKAEALQKWIKKHKEHKIIGGIAVQVSNNWKINNNDVHKYDPNFSEWKKLDEFFNISK